ncbi:MAG TPA: hypothetical protein VEK74_05445 [Burkholderiaceae bacterium]|nr:hypothetical protein [Burkholderiaceae bacterium]
MSSPTFALTVPNNGNGIIGGGHAGYNFQTGQFVYKIEADIAATSIGDTYAIPPPFTPGTFGTEKLNWEGSLRGRLGIAAGNALFYGTGGWGLWQLYRLLQWSS